MDLQRTNYFSKDDQNIDKNDLINSMGKETFETSKIYQVDVTLGKNEQDKLLKNITGKENVRSVTDLNFSEKQAYENKIKEFYKDAIDNYNKEAPNNQQVDFYAKISYDEDFKNNTKISSIVIDKNENEIDKSKLENSIEKTFKGEIMVKPELETKENSKFQKDKIIYQQDNISIENDNDKQLKLLKGYLNDLPAEEQEHFVETFSSISTDEGKEKYLENMEKTRIGRDYMEVLKDDSALEFDPFNDGQYFVNEEALEFDDFKSQWKENFNKENGIDDLKNDLGLDI